jgi:virginiamycin B lyase
MVRLMAAAMLTVSVLEGCASVTVSPSPVPSRTPQAAVTASPSTARATPPPFPLASVTHPMADLVATLREAKIAVGGAPGAPDWQVIGFGSVWVANSTLREVQRIDPATNAVIAAVKLSDSPCDGLAVGAGSVWAPGCETGTLYRIDPDKNRITARIKTPIGDGDGEGLIGADGVAVWLFTDGNGTLSRIDPRTNTIVTRVTLPAGSFSAIVDGAGSVWVTSYDANMVERIDEKTNKVIASIPVGRGPRFEAVGLGAVWVLNQGDGTVTRIDPATNTVAATIAAELPGNGGCIAVGEGAVWVTMPNVPVSRIDPATNQVTDRYRGDGGDCISAGLGSVWLSNHQFGDVWRIRPTTGP